MTGKECLERMERYFPYFRGSILLTSNSVEDCEEHRLDCEAFETMVRIFRVYADAYENNMKKGVVEQNGRTSL